MKLTYLLLAFLFSCAHQQSQELSNEISFQSNFIFPVDQFPQSHSVTLAEISPLNKMMACWYSGSHEMGSDVQIYCSTAEIGSMIWSKPQVAIGAHERHTGDSKKSKSMGNPVLYFDEDTKITYLFFGTVTVGGWRGVRTFYRTSKDFGNTWSESIQVEGAFPGDSDSLGRIGKFVRTKPFMISKTEIILPMYSEWDKKISFTCSFKKIDELFKEDHCDVMPGKDSLQPSLVRLKNTIHAYTRSKNGFVQHSTYDSQKREWSELKKLTTLNPDSSVDTATSSQNEILLIGNNSSTHRQSLDLLISKDGEIFNKIFSFDKSANEGSEFSYPALIKSHDGHYHLAYTYNRKAIKYVTFNEAWLQEKIKKAP